MGTSLRQRLGQRIRALRKARGWTQEELGHRAGMDYKYLGAIERGERNFPVDVLARLASGLGAPVHALFIFDAPDEPEPELLAEKNSGAYQHAALEAALASSTPRQRALMLEVMHAILRHQ